MKELTLILVNALLVLIVICVYVHLSYMIKNEGVQIKVLQQQVKESMSAAQRYGLAGMYVGKKQNLLLPSDKQPKDSKPSDAFPLITNSRGNFNASGLYKSRYTGANGESIEVTKSTAAEVAENINVPVIDAVTNGAATVGAVAGLKPTSTIETDDTRHVEPVQNGQIESGEKFTGVNSRIQPAAAFLFTSSGKSVIADKQNGIPA